MDGRNIHKSKKNDPKTLMESIRKNPPQLRGINEIVSILHVISSEQRSCSSLRSCVDKVLMNMSDIHTLRDIIERLRSVSRTNGLRFELPSSSGPETRCNLISDMFNVEILLGTKNTHDQSPTVVDVRIQHHKDDYKSCPHLVNIIRAGKFLELSTHLKGLTDMYLTTMNRQTRTKVYLALQSLETDLVKMNQVFRETHKDATNLDVAMKGTVGLLTPRVAGERSHLTYYLSPYDLLDTPKFSLSHCETVPRDVGLHAEVGIEQRSTQCSLPISPLIFNNHSIDNSGIPRFMESSQHNSMNVQACFVLYLRPGVPVLSQIAEKIKNDTNLAMVSNGKGYTSYLELLKAQKDTYKIEMEKQKHIYHLNISELKGIMVNKVYFTHPGHVMKILRHLRKQAHLNTLLSSCIRENTMTAGNVNGEMRYFEVSCGDDIDRINVTMENPLCNGTAFLEIRLNQDGLGACKIFNGRGDPPLCTDKFARNVLQKCMSIPITIKKLIEQSIKHPRKESEGTRVPALFMEENPIVPNLLTPVIPSPIKPHLSSTTSTTFTNTISKSFPSFSPLSIVTTVQSILMEPSAGKESRHPMLTRLLKPMGTEAVTSAEPTVQPKDHPMLLGLLKEHDTENDVTTVSVSRMGKITTSQIGFSPHAASGNHLPPYNLNYDASQLGFNPSQMDTQIPIPSSHPQMPPPSYPSHPTQNQFGNQMLQGVGGQPSPANTSPQFQVPLSPYSAQRSPINSNSDDITGPVTPTYPLGMMSPGLISPSLPVQNRGRRGSRQKSRSIESQQSVGSIDFSNFDIRAPAYDPMNMDSDSMGSDFLSMQNRTGMTPIRRTDSVSPVVSSGVHLPLQQSSSSKGINDYVVNNNLVTRSSSVGNGGKGYRSMTSPGARNLKTPTLPSFDTNMMGSPPLFDGTQIQRQLSRGRSYEGLAQDVGSIIGNRGEFFPSVSPIITTPNSQSSGSLHDQDTDPFMFDDSKGPSKISMPDSVIGAAASRNSKLNFFQASGKQGSQIPNLMETESADLQEPVKSTPLLFRELTRSDTSNAKTESPSLSRMNSNPMIGTTANFTSSVTTQSMTTSNSSNDAISRFSTTTVSIISTGDKNLVRQNAIDKQTNSAGQTKQADGKVEKTVKRRNSAKGEDGKVAPKKRGRPPSAKEHGGKRKKPESSQSEDGSSHKSVTLNIQFSSTGAPISSTTKTKPLGVAAPLQKNMPAGNAATPSTTSTTTSATVTTSASSAPEQPKFGVDLEKYLKNQEEQSRRKRENKEKKAMSSPSTLSGSIKSSLNKQSVPRQSFTPGAANLVEKSQMSTPKPGSTSPRAGVTAAQKRSRKTSINDVIERLTCKSPANIANSMSSPANSIKQQGIEKDANSNLVSKPKNALSLNTGFPKPSNANSNSSKNAYNKFSIEDKTGGKSGIMRTKSTSKPSVELVGQGKSSTLNSGVGLNPAIASMREFEVNSSILRKDSTKTGRSGLPESNLNTVLERIQKSAAASARKGADGNVPNLTKPASISEKIPRLPVPKGRSVTPTPQGGNSTPQRKSPSSQLKAPSNDLAGRPVPKQMSNSNSVTPSPVKKSPSRAQTPIGLSSRSNSIASEKSLSSTNNSAQGGILKKSQPINSSTELPGFVAPSISPTPKRTTSPQVLRTASPLTRLEDKSGKGIPNRSPHRPSPSNSRITTPVPTSSPQSPDDRLVIDDPAIPSHNALSAAVGTASISRDEQRPVFLQGNRGTDRQSPERTVMPSPLSPPSNSVKSSSFAMIRRASTPRGSLTPSPSLIPVNIPEGTCNYDDDLMDQAVTG